MNMGLVLVILALLCAGSGSAQSSCMNVLLSMYSCLDYVTGNSSTPSSECCSQLANVVRSQPQCLCQVLDDGGESLGIKLNQTLALALPEACKVSTPPVSQCKIADSPTGSKTVPSTKNGSSAGNAIKLSNHLWFVIFAATYICFNFKDMLLDL